jgi:urea transporter
MDTILAVFVETIKFMFLSIYGIISALVEQTAKGNALACILLVGLLIPFAFAFLRLIVGQGRVRPMRRPRGRR